MLNKYKEIALRLGINHSPNIGEDTLLNKIKEVCIERNIEFSSLLKEDTKEDIDEEYINKVKNISLSDVPDPYDPNDYNRLIRVQITCLDPSKNKNTSEIFTVGNLLTTQTKCIPYNNPTHITKMMYDAIKEIKYQNFMTSKNPRTGEEETTVRLTDAYSIQELPPLTPQELQAIAQEQLARK